MNKKGEGRRLMATDFHARSNDGRIIDSDERLRVSVPEGVFFPFFRTPPFVIPQEKELIP